MPCSVDVSVESSVSVEQVHAAFGDQSYWLARIATFGGGSALDALTVDTDGTVTMVATQRLVPDRLPRVIARVLPDDLQMRHIETWTPIGERRVSGRVSIKALGTLGAGHGTALLAPAQNGSRLTLDANVEVKLPIIGGKIENYIASQLAENIPAIQRFTAAWIAERV